MNTQSAQAALKAVATDQPPLVKLEGMRPKDAIAYLLDKKKGEIAKMLPRHLSPERLLKVAQIAATTTPTLLKCDVPSLVGAIGQCAQMGLEPNTVLGHAYLVPFNTKRKDANGNERWINSVQVIVGYKGLIDLARRSGQVVSIAAHEVCEKDKFELCYGLEEKLIHVPNQGDRGEIIGFYAVAKLKDGGYAFEFMSRKQVEDIREASQGYQQAKKLKKEAVHPWTVHFVEMGRKTVIRRLAKYLPLSIEFQTAVAVDELAAAGKDQRSDAFDGEFGIAPQDDETGATGEDPGYQPPALTDERAQQAERTVPSQAERQQESARQQQAQQQTESENPAPPEGLDAPTWSENQVAAMLKAATTEDALDTAADLIQYVDGPGAERLGAIYKLNREEIRKASEPKQQAQPRGRRAQQQNGFLPE